MWMPKKTNPGIQMFANQIAPHIVVEVEQADDWVNQPAGDSLTFRQKPQTIPAPAGCHHNFAVKKKTLKRVFINGIPASWTVLVIQEVLSSIPSGNRPGIG
jgi:hypothetical protein